MNASSRHLTIYAVAGLVCLAGISYGQEPDQDLSKKEKRQLRQQERQSGGGGQGGKQSGQMQQPAMQRGPSMQGGPSQPINPNMQSAPQIQNVPPSENLSKQSQKNLRRQMEPQVQGGSPDLGAPPTSQGKQGGANKKQAGTSSNIQIQDAQEVSKKERQEQNRLEEEARKQAKQGKQAGDDAVSAKATPFVPAGLPPGDEANKKQQNRLEQQAQKEAKQQEQQAQQEAKRLEQQNKGKDEQAQKAAKQQEQQAQQEAKRLEQLQKQQEQDAQKSAKQLEQQQKQDAQQAQKEANKLEQQQKQGGQQALKEANKLEQQQQKDAKQLEQQAQKGLKQQEQLAKKEQKVELKDAKQAEQSANQAAKQLAQLDKKQQKIDIKKMSGAEKAVMVGADASHLQGNSYKKLSKKDSISVIGDNNTIIKNKYVDKDVIYKNHGYPDDWDHHGHHGHHNHHDDDDDDWIYAALLSPLVNYALSCATCLPSVPVVGVGYSNLNWNYWDGRNYYDHGYADSMFTGLGHYRYNGCDGVIAGGRYYSYGYGWMPGCIDYGDRRIWAPGFWAPYTVEECGSVPIWIPPVYEEVWTGCCWETVQVDGGYFGPAPLECHLVTRYSWVPGHFQYAYI